ncbi:TylF/MycF/NovP-related O-methyltransferase [Oceanibacterium hippocampi]|uniref:Macrocin-O-methyltransferase (TylF) n=1 Tax=Oceanibacterium hippocampi TaxID=745714 RepID=A0A1Y5TQ69_9PROT|nr:TylF/MycF/NovP-related O-methyltransferase [Oceanibacterium hippocampi]SLN69415.1 Macrocin-O-methyltransferase (TylF) [Oceanibacterium hippocampi]
MKTRQIIARTLQQAGLNRFAHRLYYNHLHGFRPAVPETVDAVRLAIGEAATAGTLNGRDYYEFGLFKGYSFWQAQVAGNRHDGHDVRYIGFDSFKGLPEVDGIDRTENDEFYEGQYQCAKEMVVEQLDERGFDWSKALLIEGYFDESLVPDLYRKHDLRPVSVALIDCDLYSSTRDVLEFLEPLIADRSILIFDDWNCFGGDDKRGQRRAFAEFRERNPQFIAEPMMRYGAYGQVFRIGRHGN